MKHTRKTRWAIRLAVVATAFTTGMFVSTPFANSVAARPVPASAPVVETAPTTTSVPLPPPTTTSAPLPTGRVAHRPLRILLVGDSMMDLTAPGVKDVLQPQIAGRRVSVVSFSGPGTGLLSKKNFDWHKGVQDLINEHDPDIIVAMFTGNCPTPMDLGADGQPIVCETPAFYAAWAHASDLLTGIMTSRGAQAVWVLPPPELGEKRTRGVRALRDTYLALTGTHPGVRYVDAQAVLGGPNGEYLTSAPGPDGTDAPLRTPDTVHLAAEGIRRLSDAIHAEVQPDIDRVATRP